MKKRLLFLILIGWACDNDQAWDCVQTAGPIEAQFYVLDDFQSIIVHRDVELIVRQADTFSLKIETGKNLLNDITAEVKDGTLTIADHNTCNFVRAYGLTKAYVTAPNLQTIRNSSQYPVRSEGVLDFPLLKLISEDFSMPDYFALGDFFLNVQCEELNILSNGLSSFYIAGSAQQLNVTMTNGNGRFQGENLLADHVAIFHRGTNNIIVNPQQSLTGELRSTGNLIAVNQPPVVDIRQYYTGKLIFE